MLNLKRGGIARKMNRLKPLLTMRMLAAMLRWKISRCSHALGRYEGHGSTYAVHEISLFPNIKLCLVVGECGIIPKIEDEETLLGDFVISNLVKQYDRGKEYPMASIR